MFEGMFIGSVIISLNVVIHTIGLLLTTLIVASLVDAVTGRFGYMGRTITITLTVHFLFLIHTVQVWVWGFYFWYVQAFPDFETALYFSLITFTTLGYGDVIIGEKNRILAGMTGMNGFLLIGWSTAYLASVSTRFGPFKAGNHFN